jgi:uncharacterized membrane protein YkoI
MTRARLAVLLTAAIVAHGAAAHGGDASAPAGATPVTRAESLTLDEAVARMERKYDARAVRAEEKREDGRRVYRIRLLSADGRVFDVTVDAASGQVE